MKHGKKYTDSVKAYDRAKLYEVKEKKYKLVSLY